MLDKLKEIIEKYGAKHWAIAARKDQEFLKFVMESTSDLDVDFPTRVYAAVSNTKPPCDQGGMRKVKSIQHALENGWAFCGTAGKCVCAKKSVSESCKKFSLEKTEEEKAITNAKRAETNMADYGVVNIGQTAMAKAAHKAFYKDADKVAVAVSKGESSMMINHNVRNALQLPSVNEYRKKLASSLSEEQKESKKAKQKSFAESGLFLDYSYQKLFEKFNLGGFGFLTSREEYEGVGGTGKRIRYNFSCSELPCGLKPAGFLVKHKMISHFMHRKFFLIHRECPWV